MSEDTLDFPLRIGRLARAVGLQGEVVLQTFRKRAHAADPRCLSWRRLKAPLEAELEFPDEQLMLVRVTHARWLDPARVALRLDGVEDRDAAEDLVGAYFDIDPARRAPEVCDDVDALFAAQVLDADTGQSLGEVLAIRDNGAQALLEIELSASPDAAPALVPVVSEFVVEQGVGPDGRWVRIRVVPGLLDANL